MPRAHTERQKQVTLRTKKKKKLVILFVSRLSSTSTTRCFIARERKRKGSSRLQPLRNCTDRSRLAVPTFAVSTAATSRTRSRQKPKLHPRRVAEGPAQLRAAGLNARSQRRKHARLCAPDIWKCGGRRRETFATLFHQFLQRYFTNYFAASCWVGNVSDSERQSHFSTAH